MTLNVDEDVLEASGDTRKRSSYQPEMSTAAIKKIIQDAMARENVKEKDIPEEGPFISPAHAQSSKRYIEVKGFAWFSCPKKHHRWPSAQSWCFIDLKRQEICYRDYQKCKKCNSGASPEFTRESIEKMAQYAVKRFLIKTKRLVPEFNPSNASTDETQGGPHDEGRCGRCNRLGKSCWK